MELQGKIINFMGDSITEGCGTTEWEVNRFSSIIEREFGLCKANNYGICATCIAVRHVPSPIERENRSFCTRVDEMDENADAVVVFGGTNDFGHGDADIGSFEDRTTDTFYGSCHTLMLNLINRYPGKQIVFITPLHREYEINLKGQPLELFVNIIKEVAKYYSIPVLDLYAESGIQPCVPIIKERFCPDGLHPNDAGHIILADKISKFLLRL